MICKLGLAILSGAAFVFAAAQVLKSPKLRLRLQSLALVTRAQTTVAADASALSHQALPAATPHND